MKPYSTVIDSIRTLAGLEPERTSVDKYFNYKEGKPECIFGHVIALLGGRGIYATVLSPDGLTVAKGYQDASDVDWSALGVERPGAGEASWSNCVQGQQDVGLSWGEAVRLADAYFPLTQAAFS